MKRAKQKICTQFTNARSFSYAEPGEDGVHQILPDVFSVQFAQSLQRALGVRQHHVRRHADPQGRPGVLHAVQRPAHRVGLAGVGQQLARRRLPRRVQRRHSLRQRVQPLSLPPELTYSGDEYAVRQLVSILLDNAVKYAAPDSPISLSLEKERRGVILRCANRCTDPDSIDPQKLFDRFYQADPSRGAGGFGVGLSIARGIAEGHHGAIHAALDGDTITFTAQLR